MNILFGSPKPNRVTEQEMDKIRRKISTKLDEQEERDVDNVFHSALHDSSKLEGGITHEEYELGMERLREHSTLEDDDLRVVERHFKEHLRD